jgi:hypothetical protein
MDAGRWAVVCNQVVDRAAVRGNACSYLADFNIGNGNDRVRVVTVSRGGRLINRWEDIRRLKNFRPRFIADGGALAKYTGNPQIRMWESKQEAERKAAELTVSQQRELR